MNENVIVWLIGLCWLLTGCVGNHRLAALDEAIPQVETSNTLIATVCFKTHNGKLVQTKYLDQEGRELEEYNFGRTNSRVRNQYEGPLKVGSVVHFHSDSSGPGSNDVSSTRYEYDQQGRLRQAIVAHNGQERVISYSYTATGDTLKSVKPELLKDESTQAYVDQWTRNRSGQLVRHYVFYSVQDRRRNVPDTIWHSSQRYAYRPDGKRKLAWYDYMYLGEYYWPAGPDTIRYAYDRQGRLVGELQRYTINMANKQEIDSTRLDSSSRQVLQFHRKLFFNGADWRSNNEKTDTIQYSYEAFNPKRHLPLHVPPLN